MLICRKLMASKISPIAACDKMASEIPPFTAKTETGRTVVEAIHPGEWEFNRTLLFVIAVLLCLQERDKTSRRSWTNLLRRGINSTKLIKSDWVQTQVNPLVNVGHRPSCYCGSFGTFCAIYSSPESFLCAAPLERKT